MLTATALVFAFIGSYALKLIFIGREDLDSWSPVAVHTLQLHELCVASMLISGGLALHHGAKLRKTRRATHDEADPLPEPKLVRLHRLSGRVAVSGAVLGLFLAAWVLAGMYARAV